MLRHRDGGVDRAERRLHSLVVALTKQGAADGELRGDVRAAELPAFCPHPLTAAATMLEERAADRLLHVAPAGLRAILRS